MKAKVIKTGEIVEVYHEPQHGQVSNIYKESVLVNGRMWEEDELDFSINSESKKVDLDDKIHDYINTHYSEGCDGGMISDAHNDIGGVTYSDLTAIAKHFFELGIKAQKGE